MTIDYSIIQKIKKNLSFSRVNCKMENHKGKLKNKEQNLIWNNKKKECFFCSMSASLLPAVPGSNQKYAIMPHKSSSNCFGSAHYLNLG